MLNKRIYLTFIGFVVLLIISFSIYILFFNNVNQYKNEQYTIASNSVEQEIYIDLYKVYYSLETNSFTNSLSKEQTSEVKKYIKDYSVETLIFNSVSIHDLWLYTKICEKLNLEIDDPRPLLEYVQELRTDNGYYLSNRDEDKNLDPLSYLLDTKMSIEVLQLLSYEFDDSEREQTHRWLISNFPQSLDKEDILSYTDLYYLAITTNELLGFDNALIMNKKDVDFINEKLTLEEDSLLKFLVISNFNKLNEKNKIQIDKEYLLDYLNSLQREDGGYPLYGDINQDTADILSTYHVYHILDSFDIDYSINNEAYEYIKQVMNESIQIFDINKN